MTYRDTNFDGVLLVIFNVCGDCGDGEACDGGAGNGEAGNGDTLGGDARTTASGVEAADGVIAPSSSRGSSVKGSGLTVKRCDVSCRSVDI